MTNSKAGNGKAEKNGNGAAYVNAVCSTGPTGPSTKQQLVDRIVHLERENLYLRETNKKQLAALLDADTRRGVPPPSEGAVLDRATLGDLVAVLTFTWYSGITDQYEALSKVKSYLKKAGVSVDDAKKLEDVFKRAVIILRHKPPLSWGEYL